MTSALERLASGGKDLKAEPPDAKEFAKLRDSGIVRLADARMKRCPAKAGSTSSTTRRTPYAWRHFAITVTVRQTDTWSSSCCLIRSDWDPRCGAC